MTLTERDSQSMKKSLEDVGLYTPRTSMLSRPITSPPVVCKSRVKRSLEQGNQGKRRRPLPLIPDDLDSAPEMSFHSIAALPVRRGQSEHFNSSTSFIPVVGPEDDTEFVEDFVKADLPLMPSSKDLFSGITIGGAVAYGIALAPRFRSSRLQQY